MSTIVIPCAKHKQGRRMRADQLYIGGSFTLARRGAIRTGRPWLILSAKYGLVRPDELIAPYEQTVKTPEDVARLAFRLKLQTDPGPIESWCPKLYTEAMELAGWTVTAEPLAGLTIGHQWHFFRMAGRAA